MRTRASLAVVAAVGLLAGCAGGPEATRTGDSRPPEPGQGSEARSVRLVLSGGITGAREVVRVTRADGPADRTAAETERILDLAASKAVRSLPSGEQRRPAGCCDRRVLDLTVRYADGSTTRVRTAETDAAQPPQLRRLVALMSSGR